jgi:hypothetical protein
MRCNRALLLLIPAISAIFLTTNYNVSFASGTQSLSQSTIVECNGIGGSCYTVSCSNDQPCQTFSSNQPSFVQPSQKVTTTTTQPVEETPIMQSADDGIVMQPIEDSTEQYIEVPVEFCLDSLDNDDDGKVNEECGAATSSSALPNDLIDGEEKIQNEEYERSDVESNQDHEEKEHED